MEYNLNYLRLPSANEFLATKQIQIGENALTYWVTKKQDDSDYEKINSDIDGAIAMLIGVNKDGNTLKQAYMNSQKALFKANNQIDMMQQMIMKLQKQQFTQQQNTGGTTNVSK